MQKIFQNKLILFIFCFLLVFVLIGFHFLGILKPVENIVFKVSSPVQRVGYSLGSGVSNVLGFLSSIKDLTVENGELKLKLEKSLVDKSRLEELEKENNELRDQLSYKKKASFELISGIILSKDPNSLSRSININKGSKDNIEKDDYVVVSDGILIGQVEEVYNNYSKVILITDIYSRVKARIQDSDTDGIVSGEHGLGMVMDLIPQNKVVKKGDTVVTYDSEKELPGLLIGEVEEVNNADNELFQKARIKSPVDFKELSYIFVLKDKSQ
jgi:rod shape-determining protein MreC